MDLFISLALTAVCLTCTFLGVAPVLRHRTTDGIALSSTLTSMFGTSTWVFYGVMQANDTQVLINAVAAMGGILILGFGWRQRRLALGTTAGFAAAYLAFIAAIATIGGAGAVGAAVTALSVVNKIPQIVETWRRPGGLGVSVPANLVTGGVGAGWLAYGLIHSDLWLIVSSVWCGGQAVFIAHRTWSHRQAATTSSSNEASEHTTRRPRSGACSPTYRGTTRPTSEERAGVAA